MSDSKDWIEEKHDDFGFRFRVTKRLFAKQSEFQHVEVVDTAGHGKMLFNDGLVMISERDEFVYHDMIAHVPLFVHRAPKKVLIIGGGDGGTMREVLRHDIVDECTLVEIDAAVIDSCKEHIPLTSAAFDHEKARTIVGDGVKFVAETDERFDIVIVDSTDPIGPAAPLFGSEFYGNVKRVLSYDGIVVSQGESPFFELETQRSMVEIAASLFEHVHVYNYSNITYPGGFWSFIWASKTLCPLTDFQTDRLRNSKLTFRYYNEATHKAAFALPQFQLEALTDLLSDLPQFTQ